jgi:hypothetical protein
MRAITPYYPAGAPGIGLVLLRLAVAGSLVMTTGPGAAPLFQVGVALLALGVGSGFQTRLLSALSLLISVSYVSWGPIPALVAGLPSVLSCAALALAGPGAFSIDARLFGSRTVILSKSRDRSPS